MNSPSYRIVTICPRMSERLNSYLDAPVKGAEHMCVKEAIALEFTSHYAKCQLPFAGTVLAWGRSDAIDSGELREWLNCLQELKIWNSNEVVSLEAFVQTVDGGSIAVGGFYPIATVPPDRVDVAYKQASLVINAEQQKELTNSAYRRILAGALQTDQVGMIIAVLAEEAEVAQSMIKQAVSLVVPSAPAGANQ